MADVFSLNDARRLLKDRFMLMIGDSNTRAIYKDLLCLLHEGVITPEPILRRGSEAAPQYGDEIVSNTKTYAGRGYFEIRQCKRKELWVRFIFVTQAAAQTVKTELERLESGTLPPPDIVLINSCLWDLTRWGPEQEDQYKRNVASLFHRLRALLPPSSLVVWLASLPVATERVKGGVFIQQIEFMKHSMRFMLLEANMFMHNLCQVFGFSFLDLHYYMQYQLNRRTNDGLHWEPPAIRYITNIILTHIALSLNDPLPGNVSDTYFLRLHDKAKEEAGKEKQILLDSKIVKYLKELGLKMENVVEVDDGSDSGSEKSQPPKKRVVRQARRTTTTTKNKKSQPPPAQRHAPNLPGLMDFPPNSLSQGSQGPSVPPWVRSHQGHGPGPSQHHTGMQIEGPHEQHFDDGAGPSGYREGPGPGLGIEAQFSSMHMMRERTFNPQHGHMMLPQRFPSPQHPNLQAYQQHFNPNPNEFWHNYPVNNFPWNRKR
ncbi:PC-esterase domain-containing protein 1B-like [Eriocheir sinensis]|uniref:PC-esterase domain-containing protein 1B-like n=1 Tax=Eriocheir sinensis TaxID=95602 RepID=UPI0021C5B109|nr:PC-esterase domain-containing protein 1B-like [Eriocheir sinensis]